MVIRIHYLLLNNNRENIVPSIQEKGSYIVNWRMPIAFNILFRSISSTHFNKIFSVFHFTINIQYICSKESRFPYMMVQLSVYFLSAYDHESFDVTHENYCKHFLPGIIGYFVTYLIFRILYDCLNIISGSGARFIIINSFMLC